MPASDSRHILSKQQQQRDQHHDEPQPLMGQMMGFVLLMWMDGNPQN